LIFTDIFNQFYRITTSFPETVKNIHRANCIPNTKSKIKDQARTTEDLENQTTEDSESDCIALSLKFSLNRDGVNWDLVREKWKKTFHLRQQ